MTSAEVRLSDVFDLHGRVLAHNMRVAMPAKVASYDPARSVASIELAVPLKTATGQERPAPVISGVPVMWPRAGVASITYPLKAGDYGLAVFADTDISAWVAELAENAGTGTRAHSLTDAMFLPMSHNLAPSSIDGLVVTYGTNTILLNDAGATVTAGNITLAGNVAVSGSLSVTGQSTLNGINFNSHTHGGVQTGGGITGGPI